MKAILKILPIIICFILMAAHLSRANMLVPGIICLLFPLLLFWKSKMAARTIQIALILCGLEWIRVMIHYTRIRIEFGEDWLRLALILGAVAILNFAATLIFRSRYMAERYDLNQTVQVGEKD